MRLIKICKKFYKVYSDKIISNIIQTSDIVKGLNNS